MSRALNLHLIVFICCWLPLVSNADVSTEQYAILSNVLKHGLEENCAEIVIEEKTTAGTIAIDTPEKPINTVAELLGIDVALLRKWEIENLEFEYLGENFDLPCNYHLVTAEQRDTLFSTAADDEPERGWRNFARKFPDAAGIIRMAKPTVDVENNQALAYVEFDCGPSCGSGRFVTLSKAADNSWQVTGGSLVWMATE